MKVTDSEVMLKAVDGYCPKCSFFIMSFEGGHIGPDGYRTDHYTCPKCKSNVTLKYKIDSVDVFDDQSQNKI